MHRIGLFIALEFIQIQFVVDSEFFCLKNGCDLSVLSGEELFIIAHFVVYANSIHLIVFYINIFF